MKQGINIGMKSEIKSLSVKWIIDDGCYPKDLNRGKITRFVSQLLFSFGYFLEMILHFQFLNSVQILRDYEWSNMILICETFSDKHASTHTHKRIIYILSLEIVFFCLEFE